MACALIVAALAMLAFAGAAAAGTITPESGPTQNAGDTDTLYKIVLVIGLVVIGAIWAALFLSLMRYRSGKQHEAAQVRGNSAIEWTWAVIPTVLVIAIAVLSLVMLPDIKNPASSGPDDVAAARGLNASVGQKPPADGKGLRIHVSGQQFLWRFQYPNGAVSFHNLTVPENTTVLLEVETVDVAHSWWIPALGGKVDALPGQPNETWFKATRTGSFEGQCAELCGTNHAAMTAQVDVVEPDEYRAYVSQLKSDIDQARTDQQQQAKQFKNGQG